MATGRDYVAAVLLGGIAGAVIAGGVWAYASHALDQQLSQGGSQLSTGIAEGRTTLEARLRQGEAELQNQIRTQVNSAMDQRLAAAGIDRTTGTRIARLLALADSGGLLS